MTLSYEEKLKKKQVSFISPRNAYKWLDSKFEKTSPKLNFGWMYRARYQRSVNHFVDKIILPFMIQENKLFVLDILALPQFVRASFFDHLTHSGTTEIEVISNKILEKLIENRIIKSTIRALIPDNIIQLEKIWKVDLDIIMDIPLTIHRT